MHMLRTVRNKTHDAEALVELHSRNTALIHNHKSTLFACFKALPVKLFIHALV